MIHDRRVVPFKTWHYEWLAAASAAAEGQRVALAGEMLATLEKQNSWTAVVDGAPLVCAGTIVQWPGRHLAWAYVARGTLPHMEWITAEAQRVLAAVKGRIETTVREDFVIGQRWAKRLGFQIETPRLHRYGPQGENHVGFYRLN